MKRAAGALAFILVAAATFGTPCAAQPSTTNAFRDTLLARFAGRWVLTGTIAGKPTTRDVTAEWVLGDRYLRVNQVARERDASGQPTYQANVYIGRDPVTNERTCVWLDSTPGGVDSQSLGRAPAANASGDSIPFLFRYNDGSRMHTTFIYDRVRDTWLWRLDDEPAGKSDVRRPFARVTLTRVVGSTAPAARPSASTGTMRRPNGI